MHVAPIHHGLIWRITDDVDKSNVAFLQRLALRAEQAVNGTRHCAKVCPRFNDSNQSKDDICGAVLGDLCAQPECVGAIRPIA